MQRTLAPYPRLTSGGLLVSTIINIDRHTSRSLPENCLVNSRNSFEKSLSAWPGTDFCSLDPASNWHPYCS